MAKNLINGDNIIIEEDNDNIKMNLSDSYTSTLTQSIANSYKSNNIFSTDETIVGKWINNKPIYRKVIQLPAITTTNTDFTTATGITNMENLISVNGTVKMSLGWVPLNFHNQNNTQYSIVSWLQNNMNFTQRSWLKTTGGYAILEYTKTTD